MLIFASFGIAHEQVQESAPISVVSLNPIVADLVKQIGGTHVDDQPLLPPGVSSHHFEPSAQDLRKISEAQWVFAAGWGFEPYLSRLKQSSGRSSTFVVLGEALSPRLLLTSPGSHTAKESEEHQETEKAQKAAANASPVHPHPLSGSTSAMDPHWWQSIACLREAIRIIAQTLEQADPQHTADYEYNLQVYDQRLENLDQWIRLQVATLPRNQRILITSHDAWGYFARDYGFKTYPILGIQASEQPSSQRIRNLIRILQEEPVKTLFVEKVENPKVLEAILKETGTSLGGVLYGDELGPGAESVEAMLRYNVQTLVSGLKKGSKNANGHLEKLQGDSL